MLLVSQRYCMLHCPSVACFSLFGLEDCQYAATCSRAVYRPYMLNFPFINFENTPSAMGGKLWTVLLCKDINILFYIINADTIMQ